MEAIIRWFKQCRPYHRWLVAITVLSNRILAPLVRSYLRFDGLGLSGTITRGTLWIFTNSRYTMGDEGRNVTDNPWKEGTINYTNTPAIDSAIAGSGSFSAGVWTRVDISPLSTGDSSFNLALTTTNATAFSLASREAGANAPGLVIETIP